MKTLKIAIVMILVLSMQAWAAPTTLQVTLGAAATPMATVATQCNWITIQNNATHAMRLGDFTVTATKGIQLASGSPGGSFYQGPKPTGGATNLAQFYVFGTAGDVVDVTCDAVNF